MGITATAKAKIFIGSKTYATGSNPSLAVADYTTGETYTVDQRSLRSRRVR